MFAMGRSFSFHILLAHCISVGIFWLGLTATPVCAGPASIAPIAAEARSVEPIPADEDEETGSPEIYMYVDKKGVMRFTNTPSSHEYQPYDSSMLRKRRMDPNRFDTLITEAAILHGLDFGLIKAVIHAESAFDNRAISRKGALGLMQIMPQNLNAFKVYDPFDPRQNIMGGSFYLKALLEKYDGELTLALAAYNAGPTMVEIYKGIPPFPETQTYVKKVIRYMQRYHQTTP